MNEVWNLQGQIDRLYRRVLMTVAPGLVAATDDKDPIHKIQMKINGTAEVLDNVGVMQLYGIASHAPVGTDVTALFMTGQRSNPVVIATGNQKARLRNQQPGEISLYTDEGDTLGMNRQNKINVNSKDTVAVNGQHNVNVNTQNANIKATQEIVHDTPLTSHTGDIKAKGLIDAAGGFFQNGNPITGGGGGTGPPGPAGPTGPQGPAGPPGTAGNTVLHGTASPAAAIGVNGDFYLQTGVEDMWGPKAAGAWPPSGVPLIGPQGTTGATGATGATGPIGLTGATGPAGPQGATGSQGTTGATGPQGPAGATGPQGPNWNVGSGLALDAGTPSTIRTSVPYLPLSGRGVLNNITLATPAGTAGNAFVMMGLGVTVTPVFSGSLFVTMSGLINNSVAGGFAITRIHYGTGAPPANQAAVTGTQATRGVGINSAGYAAAQAVPWSLSAVLTGLTSGTAYWLDLALEVLTGGAGGTATVTAINVAAHEI